MKWLLYSLLLINLALFVWHYQDSSSSSPIEKRDVVASKDAVSLVLLSEFVEKSEQQGQIKNICFSLGPFNNKKQSALAAKIISTETSVNPESRVRKDAKRKAYWVMLPPAETKDIAKQSVAKLKKKNVRDYFLVVSGEQTNAVSLGVYTKFESAHRRIKQIQEMGFTPRVEKVDLPKKEFWLEWEKESGEKLGDDILVRLEKVQKEIKMIERSCE